MKSKKTINDLKIAIVADWLTNFAGGENVILELHKMFPRAPIFTTVFNFKKLPEFKEAEVHTSFLQNFPFAKKKHQLFLKLMIPAIESFDLSRFDVVISSAHSIAKGIVTNTSTTHISYCHSPMRYAWDDCHNYIKNSNFPGFLKAFIPFMMTDIRIWDRLAADRVDHFIANSNFIAQRIRKYYRRESEVIFPPVDISSFSIGNREDYFVAIGRLIPYKKFDLLVETFNKTKLKLKIIGDGPEMSKLQKKANSNIEFLGRIKKQELKSTLANSRAFLFPQIEDFGIVAVEALASGKPIIAFKSGGSLDIVNKENGVFFEEQNADSLLGAIKEFIKVEGNFSPMNIRKSAFRFDKSIFQKRILETIEEKVIKD